MNKYILQDAIGMINKELIAKAEAEWKRRRKTRIAYYISSAACFILCFTAAISSYFFIGSDVPTDEIIYGADINAVSEWAFKNVEIIVPIIIITVGVTLFFIIRNLCNK